MASGLSNALGAIELIALGLIAGAFGVLTVIWISIDAASLPLLWMMDK